MIAATSEYKRIFFFQFSWKENRHKYILPNRKFDHGFQSYFESSFYLVSHFGSCNTHPKCRAECDSCLKSSSHSIKWKPAVVNELPSWSICEVLCKTFLWNARLHNNTNKTCLIEDQRPRRALVNKKSRRKKWPTFVYFESEIINFGVSLMHLCKNYNQLLATRLTICTRFSFDLR